MKYYKTIKQLPGHNINDTLVQANTFYLWETKPFYSLPLEIVENFPDWFEQINIQYKENEEIWYISLNGIIVADKFSLQKHSSLVDYGNIFRDQQSALSANQNIKKILLSED